MYQKIVVPLDGSTAAECVLDQVGSVAGKGTEVVLVRVVAEPSYDHLLRDAQLSACLDEESTKEAADYLAKLAASLKKLGIVVSTCTLTEQGPVAEVIPGFARKANAGRIGRMPGSVAERIVHHAKIPFLVVHP